MYYKYLRLNVASRIIRITVVVVIVVVIVVIQVFAKIMFEVEGFLAPTTMKYGLNRISVPGKIATGLGFRA